MWLYEKIVSQKSEPEGKSWTERSKSCHVRCCWSFLAVRTERHTRRKIHTQLQYGLYRHTHARARARTQKHTTYSNSYAHEHTKKGLPLQCCLGSWSHQPSLTPLLSVAITAVFLWVNMDGAAPSTTQAGPNNKTSKSLTPVCLPYAREGLPGVWSYPVRIASGFALIIWLHSSSIQINILFTKFQLRYSNAFKSPCDQIVVTVYAKRPNVYSHTERRKHSMPWIRCKIGFGLIFI